MKKSTDKRWFPKQTIHLAIIFKFHVTPAIGSRITPDNEKQKPNGRQLPHTRFPLNYVSNLAVCGSTDANRQPTDGRLDDGVVPACRPCPGLIYFKWKHHLLADDVCRTDWRPPVSSPTNDSQRKRKCIKFSAVESIWFRFQRALRPFVDRKQGGSNGNFPSIPWSGISETQYPQLTIAHYWFVIKQHTRWFHF